MVDESTITLTADKKIFQGLDWFSWMLNAVSRYHLVIWSSRFSFFVAPPAMLNSAVIVVVALS